MSVYHKLCIKSWNFGIWPRLLKQYIEYLYGIFCVLTFSSASNRIISAKDHASIQINMAEVSGKPIFVSPEAIC